MEQKKVQRIIGIVVVIALVIIVMPLLFGKNDFPIQQAANIKAPPFPDQPSSNDQKPVLASANDTAPVNSSSDQTAPVANEKLPVPPALSSQIETGAVDNQAADAPKLDSTINGAPSANSAAENQSVEVSADMAKKINDDSATASASSMNKSAPAAGTIIYERAPVPSATVPAQEGSKPSSTAVTTNPTEPSTISDTSVKKSEAVVPESKPTLAKVTNKPLKSVKTAQAKVKASSSAHSSSTFWVVQMGNFAVKKNAIHLAHVLQSAGYKAFTQDIKSHSGNVYTRVYIGPEFKQAQASQLSNEINQKLSFKGIVVPYAKA